MNLKEFKYIYFLGIGGIGMSSLARYCSLQNKNVLGYDRQRSEMCVELENEEISINYGKLVPKILKNKKVKEKVLVIYTPAIPHDNNQLVFFQKNCYQIMKRAELLGMISKDYFTIAIAGTHGKTSTCTMLSHVLKNSGVNCTAFLGGISRNYNTNLIYSEKSDVFIIEADEYDRSFHCLEPDIALITSIDIDHTDIYSDYENLVSSFQIFTSNINTGGVIFLEENIDTSIVDRDDIKLIRYGLDHSSDSFVDSIKYKNTGMSFNVNFNSEKLGSFDLQMGGIYNVVNALATLSISKLMNVSNENLIQSIENFIGIKRRYDIHINNRNIVYIDDYAHHPVEIENCIVSTRNLFPNRHITCVFQPHLFTRTEYFMEEFAEALSLSDKLILLDIYPAREEEIPGINSEVLYDKCKVESKELVKIDEFFNSFEKDKVNILLTMGAGDISKLVDPIKKILQ
ncbi:MAG: UDP-N-acetylmuramate--L-alanine ligase [Flavobacteriales bacterium]|nr:UDP-N-acetylmuramate--L-alanine ligase [Flavobacteriales bacterium]